MSLLALGFLEDDLRAAEEEMSKAQYAQRHYHAALQFRRWREAEAFHTSVLAHTEASLDAFMRVHRNLELLENGHNGD